MALILNIDTSLEEALICIAQNEEIIVSVINGKRDDHAAWIQPAIKELMVDGGYDMQDLNAIGVSLGPGSYTGLRIGLSTAKGLCYALKVPLVTVGTLELLAFSAIMNLSTAENSESADKIRMGKATDWLVCPMIDARRMEVFTAVYDSNLGELIKPHARILDEHSFEDLLERGQILFSGNGSIKFHQICQNSHAVFKNIPVSRVALAKLIYRNFIGNNFAALAYTEPLYGKEFFTTNPQIRGE
jgi:tRNA threonylcarbamoyladenosine biosynthesis protein TsaB